MRVGATGSRIVGLDRGATSGKPVGVLSGVGVPAVEALANADENRSGVRLRRRRPLRALMYGGLRAANVPRVVERKIYGVVDGVVDGEACRPPRLQDVRARTPAAVVRSQCIQSDPKVSSLPFIYDTRPR